MGNRSPGVGRDRGDRSAPRASPSLLVLFALEDESRPFRRRCGTRTDLRVCVTGIGPIQARRGVEGILEEARPTLVLTCGLAGALNEALRHGDVLVEADLAFELMPNLLAAGAKPGRFYCADHIATTAREKARLREETGADAVEMESGVIREICQRHGIPSGTVRVISDVADEDLPLDFNAFLRDSRELDYGGIVAAVLRSPSTIPGLVRLRRRARDAAFRLAEVLASGLAKVNERR